VWPSREKRTGAPAAPSVQLDLSGPRLRLALESLAAAAEPSGGVESYVGALALKASMFEEMLGKGKVSALTEPEFLDLCAFITPVRRRIGAWLAKNDFSIMRAALTALLKGWSDTATTDARMAAFQAVFPADKKFRWARDLAAEVLHYTAPEHYPLMTRWMWDERANSGMLREIWFGEDVDRMRIAAADDFATQHDLREELRGFVAENGVYRDVPFYIDVLCAHIYADYINDRGGVYLKADFSTEVDGMLHTRRLLGLDGIDTDSGRTRLKLIDGTAHVIRDPRLLN
jgi:hypothetical protein